MLTLKATKSVEEVGVLSPWELTAICASGNLPLQFIFNCFFADKKKVRDCQPVKLQQRERGGSSCTANDREKTALQQRRLVQYPS